MVLAAGAPALKNRFDDQHRPLVTTPAFAHWLPLPEPDAVLVVRAGARPRLVRVVTEDFWETPPSAESSHFWSGFDVIEVKTPADAAAHLPAGKVAVIASGELPFAAPGPINPPEVVASLDATRTRKTAYEIACLAEATRRAVRGHCAAAERFAADAPSELALHLAYLAASDQDDAETPYKNIVARGAHAAVLHHVHYAKVAPPVDADSLLVDAGASCLGYGSDITRTWVRGTGAGAALFAGLVDGVDRLQQAICAAIRPGLAYEALHD
ncbi:MAG: M24 family metallopeptidase, partial [Deltaproteobacteria bacterium]|nr:M24 family metallopeptidase [Kofleriaceae bacterium]